MSKWTSVVLTGLACCLTLSAVPARTALGCPPPVTQDSLQDTTAIEVRGRLQSVLLRCGPGSRAWQVVVDNKTYGLDFATPELARQAEALDGKTVVITGALKIGFGITVKSLAAAPESTRGPIAC
jgi:hypothetical protein